MLAGIAGGKHEHPVFGSHEGTVPEYQSNELSVEEVQVEPGALVGLPRGLAQ